MVPNVESVYGITSKVVTTTIGVNRSPRERIFLQKSNSSSWLLRNFGFKIRNYHKNCQASKFKYPCQKAVWRVYPGTHWFLGINIYLEELFGWCNYRNYYFVSLSTCGSWSYRAKIKIWNLVWIAEIQVCSCVGYTENQKFDLLQDEFQLNLPIIILPMRVTCSISSQESELSQFRMRLWNFDVIPTSTTYLEVLEMSTVCVQLWLKNSNFPLLATSRGRSAASKIQNKNCTQNRKNPRNCYYIFSPVGLVFLRWSSSQLTCIFSWV